MGSGRVGASGGNPGNVAIDTHPGPAAPSGVTVEVDGRGIAAAVALAGGPASLRFSALDLGTDASALDVSAQLAVGEGSVVAGARTLLAGALAGTTLAKAGYTSSVDSIGPFEGAIQARAGAAFLPDLRERLIPGARDALGYPVGSSDASISAAVLAVSGQLRLRPLSVGPGLHLDAEGAAAGVLFAPIERDAKTQAQLLASSNGETSFDIGTLAGLSRLSVQARAGVSLDEGALHGRVQVSAHSNVMDDPTFALKSDAPLALLTAYAFTERAIDASLSLDAPQLALTAHLPLATTTQDEPRIAVEAQLRVLTARAALELGPVPRLTAAAEVPLGTELRLGAQAQTNFHGELSGSVTLSWSPDGSAPRAHRSTPQPLRPAGSVPVSWNTALPAGISSLGYSQVLQALDTPEKVSAFLNPANHPAGALEYLPHNDDWSKWTPQETFAHHGGICADLHLFGATALIEHGYPAYDVQLMARTLAHDVIAYQDRDGTWNVLQYGQIFHTRAADPASAVERIFPDAMQLQLVDPRSMRTVRAGKTPWAGAISDYFTG